MDPLLSKTLDLNYLSLCAIDIITHMLEPFITGFYKAEIQRGIAKFFIKKTIDTIRALKKEPNNTDLRGNMHILSGLALSGIATRGTGGFHELHWLEHIVSGFFDNVSHPAGLSILLIPWLKYRWEKNKENITDLFSFILQKENVKKEEIFEYLDKFYKEINLERSFRKYGINEKDIDNFVKEYAFLTAKFPKFFPEKIDEKNLIKIFEQTLL